jgi:hypothetical protein
MTDQILARMAADTRIGLVLAEESRIAETANPDGRITAWAAQLGLGGLVTGHHANSPANAMFWATTEILEALAAAYLMDGGAHELPTEGKLSHLLQAVAANAKLRTISAYVPAKGAAVPNSTERTY